MVFSEDSRVKIPCILHLVRLGYLYLSLKNVSWDGETNIFPELFRSAIARINPERYFAGEVGAFTVNDILDELKKPGRDPRSMFEPPHFRDDVRTLEDLKPGMTLEGVVTNVTAFGAFVDIGVHQDGLVHVSKLSDRFVKDPSEVAHVGDRLQVRVLEVDLARKRISLSARKDDEIRPQKPQAEPARRDARPKRDNVRPDVKFTNNPFEALRRR